MTIQKFQKFGQVCLVMKCLESPFQDGHYVFQVFPGSGSGSQSDSPTLFIADIENPSQINIVVKP